MNRLTDIRLHAQQLVAPQFDDPAELIRWMGMVQAQEYGSAKWAVALRLRTPAAAPVEEALREGRILRMHIMRPTWHFIAAEDVRWMLHLSARPLIPTECLIILFNALSVFFIIFTLMRKCAPYFLPAILAFTILLTGSTLWQAKACLNRFAEKICRRFCSE